MEFTKDINFSNKPIADETITIQYNGFLKNSDELTIVYGYGENWDQTTETPMQKTETGFIVELKLMDYETFNFCFRNNAYIWDNNSNFNYITSIEPKVQFNIDKLIEEILQPIAENEVIEKNSNKDTNIKNIDLGIELTNYLSQIEPTPLDNLPEYSTLDEILSAGAIKGTDNENDEIDINLFEPEDSTTQETSNKINSSLIAIDDPFVISSRKLSKFYVLKKRIKLALYKILVKLPNLIFGTNEK